MNKRSFISFILCSLFIIVFNVIFFMYDGAESLPSQWIAYGFIHFSYLVFLFSVFGLSYSGKTELNLMLWSVSAIYFYVEFVIGLVFLQLGLETVKGEIILQIVIFAIYLFVAMTMYFSNVSTMENVKRQNKERKYVNFGSSKLKEIIDRVDDPEVTKALKKAYDIIKSSPIKSSPSVSEHELRILNFIQRLGEEIPLTDTQLCVKVVNNIISLANERNNILKSERK